MKSARAQTTDTGAVPADSDPLVSHVVAAIRKHAEAGELPLFTWTLGLPQPCLLAAISGCFSESGKLAPLSEAQYQVLLRRVPPAFSPLVEWIRSQLSPTADTRQGEWLSHAVAAACFGERPLWVDLGLADADQLKAVLARYFRPKFASRSGELGWKHELLQRAKSGRTWRPPKALDSPLFSRQQNFSKYVIFERTRRMQ